MMELPAHETSLFDRFEKLDYVHIKILIRFLYYPNPTSVVEFKEKIFFVAASFVTLYKYPMKI